MVLDTNLMASIYLPNRQRPRPGEKCLRGERSFPPLKFILGLTFEKHLTTLQFVQEISFKLKCCGHSQVRWTFIDGEIE